MRDVRKGEPGFAGHPSPQKPCLEDRQIHAEDDIHDEDILRLPRPQGKLLVCKPPGQHRAVTVCIIPGLDPDIASRSSSECLGTTFATSATMTTTCQPPFSVISTQIASSMSRVVTSSIVIPLSISGIIPLRCKIWYAFLICILVSKKVVRDTHFYKSLFLPCCCCEKDALCYHDKSVRIREQKTSQSVTKKR